MESRSKTLLYAPYLVPGSLAGCGLGGLADLSQQKIYAGHASNHTLAGIRHQLHR